jgi:hypothetical protein
MFKAENFGFRVARMVEHKLDLDSEVSPLHGAQSRRERMRAWPDFNYY